MKSTGKCRAFGLATLAWAACGLTACGGGGSGGDGPTGQAGTSQSSPSNTLAAYASARNPSAAAPGALSGADAATVAAATRHLAVEDLRARLNAATDFWGNLSNNLLAVPCLSMAHADTLLAAANGNTLDQLQARVALSDSVRSWLQTDGPLMRQVWGQSGEKMLLDFLRRTDLTGSATRTNWQGGDADFSGSGALGTAFATALAQTSDGGLTVGQFGSNTRLAVIDAVKTQVAWPAAQVINGRFLDDSGRSQLLDIVVLNQGVVRHEQAGFIADAWTTGGTTLLTIVPRTGGLAEFISSGQLEPAIADAVGALQGASASALPAGEIRLPMLTRSLALDVDGFLVRAGVALPYDEVWADFRRLDGAGGTYVRVMEPASRLKIEAGGFALDASYASAFTYSPRNVYGGAAGFAGFSWSHGTLTYSTPASPRVCSPQPDLRSLFVVTVDRHGAVVSLVAIAAPEGQAIACL